MMTGSAFPIAIPVFSAPAAARWPPARWQPLSGVGRREARTAPTPDGYRHTRQAGIFENADVVIGPAQDDPSIAEPEDSRVDGTKVPLPGPAGGKAQMVLHQLSFIHQWAGSIPPAHGPQPRKDGVWLRQ